MIWMLNLEMQTTRWLPWHQNLPRWVPDQAFDASVQRNTSEGESMTRTDSGSSFQMDQVDEEAFFHQADYGEMDLHHHDLTGISAYNTEIETRVEPTEGCFRLRPSGERPKSSQGIHIPNSCANKYDITARTLPLTAANLNQRGRAIFSMRNIPTFTVLGLVNNLGPHWFLLKHDTRNGRRGLIDRCYSIVACVRDTVLANRQETFNLLDVVERNIYRDQWSTTQPPDCRWAAMREPGCQRYWKTTQLDESVHRGFFSIIGMACFVGLHEYVEWRMDRETAFQADGHFATYLMCNVLDGLACAPLYSRLLTLRLLLERGVSPDLHPSLCWYENHDPEPGPAWHYYLYEVFGELQPEVSHVESDLSGPLKYCVDEGHWEAIKLCLRYSKAPIFSVRFRGSDLNWSCTGEEAEDSTLEKPSEPFFRVMTIPPKKEILLPFYMITERHVSSTPSIFTNFRISDIYVASVSLSAKTIRSARVTLKDIIEYMRPRQQDELLNLLRRPQETQQGLSQAGDYFFRKFEDCAEACVQFVVGLVRNMLDMFPRQYISESRAVYISLTAHFLSRCLPLSLPHSDDHTCTVSTVSLAGFALVVTLVVNRFM